MLTETWHMLHKKSACMCCIKTAYICLQQKFVKTIASKNKSVKCSLTPFPGNPHKTKHGPVQRRKVADTYLKPASSIDKHNHVCTGSLGLDPWQTKRHSCRDHRIYLHKLLPSFISILHKENDHGA